MLNSDMLNTLVLATLLAVVVGAGLYITQKVQPEEIERLEQEETTLKLRQAEVEELLLQQSGSRELAEDAVRRWNARYKVLPQHLSSPSVVEYLNTLSSSGFQSFDVTMAGVARRQGFSTLSYNVRGVGYFESLYRFIWEVENGRGMYRVNDLVVSETTVDEPNPRTDVPRRLQLVQFSFTLQAYFGGTEGMSAPDTIITVPDSVLPSREPAMNPFFPLIMASLPPNTDNLVDVEQDELISVVGEVAVFRSAVGPRPVRQGERVYLGQLTSVDPQRARVVADLSKGGIRERVEIELASGERFREATGRVRLLPLEAPRPDRPAPPQPGTPEYLRLQRARAAQTGGASAEPQESVYEPIEAAPAPSASERDARPERGVAVRPFPAPRAPESDQ